MTFIVISTTKLKRDLEEWDASKIKKETNREARKKYVESRNKIPVQWFVLTNSVFVLVHL